MARKRVRSNAIEPHSTMASQAANHLRREILMRFQTGDPLPSERELGRLLGVSRKTVRKAVEQLLIEGWLTRARGATPKVARRPDKPVQTSGILFPMDASSLLVSRFYRDLMTGLHEGAVANKRSVLYLFSLPRWGDNVLSAMMSLPNIRMVDSLFTLEIFDHSVLAELARMAPVVALDMDCQVPGVSSVCFDHHTSVQMAVKYLYDLGHRRIGLLSRPEGDPDPAVQARYDGYVQAMQRADISLTSDLDFRSRFDEVSRVVNRIMALPSYRRPTAIVAPDNAWTLALALIRRKQRIPQDISIVAIGRRDSWVDVLDRLWALETPERAAARDELDRFISSLPPELVSLVPTTVELPARRMGRLGMQEMIRRLGQPEAEPGREVLEMQLRPGNSTAPRSPSSDK